jgi:hypothetical protein
VLASFMCSCVLFDAQVTAALAVLTRTKDVVYCKCMQHVYIRFSSIFFLKKIKVKRKKKI